MTSHSKQVTTDTILDWLKDSVEQKRPIDAHTWVDSAQKLNVLISDENNRLYELQQEVAKLKVLRIESGESVAKAEVYVQATDEYKKMKIQAARIEQIQESIRISKIQARLSDNEMKNY